ncbi:glycosyltransferase family 4 protein [Synechococcus sp. BSF8S]|uniref:glycosyltransferase family 4 protein n=1 Tax=Synechococcales TaxID=1890424 RepID=UPI00162AA54D|nr:MULTISPECIES: glycosyltransferase family 4 protein [unclassified Synechococcus]MBC1261173.1 glycosyltransferase family 4 protein [Synechococcus sp. BSF8S]MBC1264076.1 glycosyltransferase family 4 protein [Synechococcus sp. BSA11S]
MSACLFYHPDGYTTAGKNIMGRHVAGESFLRGYLRYGTSAELWIHVVDPEHAKQFRAHLENVGVIKSTHFIDHASLGRLAMPGSLFYPSPGIGGLALKRSLFGHNLWSLCGITHTTCSAGAMDSIIQMMVSPIQSWDALICTSEAVKGNVGRLLDSQEEFLRSHLGATRIVRPQLPVIPLGIHAHDFAFSEAMRAEARASWKIKSSTVVVMFMGRLSFHAKAHPLGSYQALELAAQKTGTSVLLVECGWHANDAISGAFAEAAQVASPHIKVLNLDGRDPHQRSQAWAGADVFVSLSDSIQETFGITPIEAMAAGIPVVVSDWNGYRDTVRHGKDGFLIPTLMPPSGLGWDLAQRHALETDTYDQYCGYTCSFVAVEVDAAAAAFARLFQSPALRRQMGQQGRLRAQELFDWRTIIPRYEQLWQELAERRTSSATSQESAKSSGSWPARMDPFKAFAGYPSAVLKPQTRVGLVDTDIKSSMKRYHELASLAMVAFALRVLPTHEEIAAILAAAAHGPQPAHQLLATLPLERRALVFRSLVWLIKLHLLRVAD